MVYLPLIHGLLIYNNINPLNRKEVVLLPPKFYLSFLFSS
nr:MAG TPA: hypothetical protein [Caudoviricetes sp.]